MNQHRRPGNRQMSRQMFVFMCYAYMVLGVCTIVAGGLVYELPLFLGRPHPKHIDAGLGFIIVVLVGFGIGRIATAVVNLRRIVRGGNAPAAIPLPDDSVFRRKL